TVRERFFPLLLDSRVLLVAAIAIAGWALVPSWRSRRHEIKFARQMGFAVWAVFAAALLAKMFLAPRFSHYGFVLAMPATLLAIVFVLEIVPRPCYASWRGGAWFRTLVAIALVLDATGYVLL